MNQLLAALKFVQGAVARKDIKPEMTHFSIENNRVTAFNGQLALSSPLDCAIDCSPKATTLIKAIQQCEDTVAMSLTPAGKLRVASGKLKVLVNCVERTQALVKPEGQEIPINGEVLVKAFKMLEPFIADDASRPWSNGILLRDNCAYATCNVILVQYWLGQSLPHPVNIPYAAVKEVIRIGEPPVSIRMDGNSVSFMYESERWIRTQLFPTDWPDSIQRILDKPSDAKPLDPEVFNCVATLKPFLSDTGSIFFNEDVVSTHVDDEEGGHCKIEQPIKGIYAYDMFMALKGVATHADLTEWPRPCMFFGPQLRGAIIGRTH